MPAFPLQGPSWHMWIEYLNTSNDIDWEIVQSRVGQCLLEISLLSLEEYVWQKNKNG